MPKDGPCPWSGKDLRGGWGGVVWEGPNSGGGGFLALFLSNGRFWFKGLCCCFLADGSWYFLAGSGWSLPHCRLLVGVAGLTYSGSFDMKYSGLHRLWLYPVMRGLRVRYGEQ